MKKIKKKILIIATCFVCIFAPIHSNYMQVKALTGVEEVAIAGVLGILALCGIGVAEDATDGIAEMADNFVKGYMDFGKSLADNVKDKWDTLLATATATGAVALDLFNSLTGELGNFCYDLFNSPPIVGGDTTGNELLDLAFGISLASSPPMDVLIKNDYLLDYLEQGYKFIFNTVNNEFYFLSKEFSQISIYVDSFIVFNGASSSIVNILRNSSTGVYRDSKKFLSFSDLSMLGKLVFDSSLVINFYNSGSTLTLDSGKWTLGDLELDPPIYKAPDLELLDESYINYGDIADVALPRYVGPDATYTTDGVIDYPGTYAFPNTYNPTLDSYKPIPIPFPLPDVATVPKDYVGDITKDTELVKDNDYADDPDYKVPTVKDFLKKFEVPGKLNWKDYFPFCIPFDLIKFLGILVSNPEAPSFNWHYNIAGFEGDLNINLEQYNSVAVVCRTMFNLLFVVGLLMVTRDLIKG